MGTIALRATAATAGVALHRETQAVEFVSDCHRRPSGLWAEQNRTNSEIVS